MATAILAASVVAGQPTIQHIYRVYSPNKDWALEIPMSDFAQSSEGVENKTGTYHLRAHPIKDGKPAYLSALLDVSLEAAQIEGHKASLDELIADRVRKAKKSGDVVQLSEFNHIPICRRSGESHDIYLSYYPAGSSASPFPGQSTYGHPRHAIEAFLIKNDRFVVIGLYTTSPKSEHEKAFYALLDSVKLIDTSSPITSFDHYSKGRAFFIAAEYRQALVFLATALALEEKQRHLDLFNWRDLLEMTGVSLGNSGDSTQAKKVFEYGAANDPDYPAFHLWLARYYTALNDLDNTIAGLEKAFAAEEKNKDWALDSTFQQRDLRRWLPDPLTDPSFKKFAKDDKFRKAVKVMAKNRHGDI